MKTRSILALTFAAVVAGAVPAWSQMMGGGGAMMGGSGAGGMGGPDRGHMGMAGMMGGMHGAGAGCPGMAGMPAAVSYEAPWISMALARAQDLGLTADQVTRLTSLRDEFQREASRIAGEIHAIELELERLYGQRPVDLAAVEGKIRAIVDLQAQLRIGRVSTLEKGWALLTAEQREKLGDHDGWMRRMHGA